MGPLEEEIISLFNSLEIPLGVVPLCVKEFCVQCACVYVLHRSQHPTPSPSLNLAGHQDSQQAPLPTGSRARVPVPLLTEEMLLGD